MGIFKKTKRDFDNPEIVSKSCSKRIANDTAERVTKNLKEKKVIY